MRMDEHLTKQTEQSVDDALSRISVLMLALLGVLFVAIISLSHYQTAAAQKREADLAASALLVRGEHIGELAYDYSTWEDVIENVVVKRDYDWADDNIGKWVFDKDRKSVV